jgi:hypothetical protein
MKWIANKETTGELFIVKAKLPARNNVNGKNDVVVVVLCSVHFEVLILESSFSVLNVRSERLFSFLNMQLELVSYIISSFISVWR